MSSFMPEAKKTYTLREILDNGVLHMSEGGKAPPGGLYITQATVTALLEHYGGDTIVPGAVNDLLGRSLVHMIGAIGTINRVVELMQIHEGRLNSVYHQLEEEGLLLASPALYEDK